MASEDVPHKCYGLSTKRKGIALLIIDPQVDFHEESKFQKPGSLAVKGSQEDNVRIKKMIDDNKDRITQINVSLDTHHIMHIAHSSFWKGKDGNHPQPFTLITVEDIQKKTWVPTRKELLEHSINYCKKLETQGKYKLIIWPEHCIVGTNGHCVAEPLIDSLNSWAKEKYEPINYVFKGSNNLTEMYSIFQAEVPIDEDPGTQFNKDLAKRLSLAESVIVCGQAKSHCVNYSVRDMFANIKEFAPLKPEDIYVLEDGCSSVTSFEKDGNKFIEFCKQNSIKVINCEDVKKIT